MNEDDWKELFKGTKRRCLGEMLLWYGARAIHPGIEKEINELIEAAYEMGRKASDLTRNEEKQHHEGNDLLKQKNT